MLDAPAKAGLSQTIVKPVFLGFVDFLTVPLRVNTSGADIVMNGTGDPDIDGFTFYGLRADVVDIGPTIRNAAGTDSKKIVVSGLQDDDILDEINDPANWRSREFRTWIIIRNSLNAQQGGVAHDFTGYMSSLTVNATPTGQVIEVNVEGYLAAYGPASNRTYLDQDRYDAGDLSAKGSINIGNNASGSSPGGNVFNPVNPRIRGERAFTE